MSEPRRLTEAILAAHPDAERLYQTSPEFRTTADMLEGALPYLVAAMVDTAMRAEEARVRLHRLIERTPPGEPL